MKVNAEVDTLLNKIVKDLEDAKAKDIQIINIKIKCLGRLYDYCRWNLQDI